MQVRNKHNVIIETGNIIRVYDAIGIRCGRVLRFFNEDGFTLAEIDVGETYFYWHNEKWSVDRIVCVNVDRIYNVDYIDQAEVIMSMYCCVRACMLYSPNTFKKVD